MNYPIEDCKKCDKYDHEKHKMRNIQRCMFTCLEYQKEQERRMFEYNRAVSGDSYDSTSLYEHGKKVVGSGWKHETD
jgi:hypothetical protein